MRKPKRRFVRRVKAQRIEGIALSIPDEIKTPIHTEQPDSVAVLTCPLCGAVRYVNQAFLDFGNEAKRVAIEDVPLQYKEAAEAIVPLARHKPCNAIMHLKMLRG